VIEKQKRWFTELREAVQRMIDQDKSLAEIKQQIDTPFTRNGPAWTPRSRWKTSLSSTAN